MPEVAYLQAGSPMQKRSKEIPQSKRDNLGLQVAGWARSTSPRKNVYINKNPCKMLQMEWKHFLSEAKAQKVLLHQG
jgi:hypothetical protein